MLLLRLLSKTKEEEIEEMPCRDFSSDDIVAICCDIARRDNIRVKEIPEKTKSRFKRSTSSSSEAAQKQGKSSIARRISLMNGIPSVFPGKSNQQKEADRRLSVDSSLSSMRDRQTVDSNDNIPGLRGRDIVAMAILVDQNGVPMKTYTEAEQIPCDEVDAADKIFLARVPVQNGNQSSDDKSNTSEDERNNIPLADILEDIDLKQRQKLMKKLDRILIRLHTTDLNTALSFLKVERYADVRKEIKTEILAFAGKELKLSL